MSILQFFVCLVVCCADWLVDDRAGKKRGGKSRNADAGMTSVGRSGGEAERRGSALGTTRESSAESGIHSAPAGSRKLPAGGAGEASRAGPVRGDDDFFERNAETAMSSGSCCEFK